MFKIFLTIYAGLEHAFEADHLLAVNTLVSHRENLKQSLKDGIFWGIGHTTTIFLVGILMIGFKLNIGENIFKNFEAGVGIMLIFLGIYRMSKLYFPKQHNHTHNTSRAAFGVGLIHGLAGSGALVVLVISQMKTPFEGLMYILIFGLGSLYQIAFKIKKITSQFGHCFFSTLHHLRRKSSLRKSFYIEFGQSPICKISQR